TSPYFFACMPKSADRHLSSPCSRRVCERLNRFAARASSSSAGPYRLPAISADEPGGGDDVPLDFGFELLARAVRQRQRWHVKPVERETVAVRLIPGRRAGAAITASTEAVASLRPLCRSFAELRQV